MISNLLRERNVERQDARQAVHIDFNFGASGITELQHLNQYGNLNTVALTHNGGSSYSLDIVLTGGELYKYNTGAPFIHQPPAPQCGHTAPGPGLHAPFELNDSVIDYGVNHGVTNTFWNGFSGTLGFTGTAEYGTSLLNDNSTVTAMPTDQDWVFKITFASTSTSNNFDGQAFILSAGANNVIDLTNSFSDVWSLRCGGSTVTTDLPFNDEGFHSLVIHYKSASTTLDAWVDGTLVASDFTAGHGNYAIDNVELFEHRNTGSIDYFHGIEIGQLAPEYTGVCGDNYHVIPTGDVNLDCVVDFYDVIRMAENWTDSSLTP